MKKLLMVLLVLIAGIAVGGAAAFATGHLFGTHPRTGSDTETAAPTHFVPVGKIIAPLVMADGRLSGYVSLEVQLGVPADKADLVTERMPLLLHAINMRTYRTPLAAGPDGMLPDIEGFRALVMSATPEVFGSGIVQRVAVTQAVPA